MKLCLTAYSKCTYRLEGVDSSLVGGVGRVHDRNAVCVLVQEFHHVIDHCLVHPIARSTRLFVLRIEPFRVDDRAHLASVLRGVKYLHWNCVKEGQIQCESTSDMGLSTTRKSAEAKAELIRLNRKDT